MKFNSITKLILFAAAVLLFASCVNNSDKPEPVIPKVPVELNVENLIGTWEVYYFTKKVIPVATNIESDYRYTENDGFKVTYNADGTYHENNAFGHQTTENGRYIIGDYSVDDTTKIWKEGAAVGGNLKKDGIFMSYIQTTREGKKVARTTKAEVPNIFATDFVFRYRDGGSVNGHDYRIEDMRYFRHTERGKNSNSFNKNVINEDDLLGRWKHYHHVIYINHQKFESFPRADTTDVYLFRIVNGKRQFYLFKGENSTKAEFEAEYKIVDDVVNIFRKIPKERPDGAKWDSIAAYKLWIDRPIEKTKMVSYDKYRDIKDALQEKEERDIYHKIANQ